MSIAHPIPVLFTMPSRIFDRINPPSHIQKEPTPITEDKGDYLGRCNITACSTGAKAVFYNHWNQRHYCPRCARNLNYHNPQAVQSLGHDMCTLVEKEGNQDGEY